MVMVPYRSNRPLRGMNSASARYLANFNPNVLTHYGKGMHGLGCPPSRLGALGLSQDLSATLRGASAAASINPLLAPVGAVIGEVSQLFKAKEGAAASGWDGIVNGGLLRSFNGRDFDDKTFMEGFKGMMDKGNNAFPGCGADAHKNPDCFIVPMTQVIAQGYLSGQVPLTATTSQVYNSVVMPWLQGGAGGLVNWSTLANEPTQQLMIQAAVDRYLAGIPIDRASDPLYKGQGYTNPAIPLATALAPILNAAPAASTVAASPPSTATVQPVAAPQQPAVSATGQFDSAGRPMYTDAAGNYYVAGVNGALVMVPPPTATPASVAPIANTSQVATNTALTPTGTTSSGTPVVPVDQTAALMAQLQAQGLSQQQAITAAIQSLQANNVPATPAVQSQVAAVAPATAGTSGLPQWLGIGLAVVAVGFALARTQKR